MSAFDRTFLIASAFALGLSLCGCSGGSDFDPSDLMPDKWFGGGKKPLPGDRQAVFPQGVPGVPQGVPPELMKGNQQAAEETPPPAAEPEPAPKPKAKPAKSAAAQPAKPKAKKPAQPATATAPAQPAQPQSAASPWPEPSGQNAWPPPNPNTFSR